MKTACVRSKVRGETDLVLSDIADRLQSDGASLAGIIKEQGHASRFENGCGWCQTNSSQSLQGQ